MRKVPLQPFKRTNFLQAIQKESILDKLTWRDPSQLICDVITSLAKKSNENIDITDLEDFLDYTRQNQSVY